MSKGKSIRQAVRLALVTSAAVSAASVSTAIAQDQGTRDDPIELGRQTVTGSRIQRVDIEGVLPVTVIDREAIEASGEINISEILRESPFNSFGSFSPLSGVSGGGQGQARVDLRGLGAERTLVLVNGRRVSNSPSFAAAAVNLNNIPLVAVDRVEILRDGASAIYGSDAIGGVINIITRQGYEGIAFDGFATSPEEPGADESAVSLVGGLSSGRGNVMLTAEHSERDIIFAKDREPTAIGSSVLGNPGSVFFADPSSPNFGTFAPDPRCPASLGSDPDNPLSFLNGPFCGYNYAGIAGETAAVKRDAITIDFNYDVADEITFFARGSFARGESFGRYAPAPALFGTVAGEAQPFISATNPINPFGEDVDLLYRFTPLGPRDNTVEDNVLEALIGLQGSLDVLGGSEWEVGLYQNRYTQQDVGIGFGLISNFRAAIAACETDGIDSPNCFDPFSPTGPDNDASALVGHTILTNNEFVSKGADIRFNFDAVSLPAGPLGVAVGFEYRDDEYFTDSDDQADAGNVFGSAGGSASGGRHYYALYGETAIPLLSGLEAQLAVRYDDYSDFGDNVSPKVGLRWQPLSSIVLRASWGEGFRAPDLESLFGAPAQSFEDAVDTLGCQEGFTTPQACTSDFQRETSFTSNPALDAEESEQYSAGIVWNPLPDLSFGLDYYNIEITNGVNQLTTQEVLDFEAECFNGIRTNCEPSQIGSVLRGGGGALVRVISPVVNSATLETDGIDFDVDYRFDTPIGQFRPNITVSYVLSYDEETLPGEGFRDLLGYADDDQRGGQPEWRGLAAVGWSYSNFFADVMANHIDSFKECIAPQPGQAEAAACANDVDSFTTVDLQIGYNGPWNGTLVLGARNVFDEEAPISDLVFGSDRYAQELHYEGYLRRIWWLRYKQSF